MGSMLYCTGTQNSLRVQVGYLNCSLLLEEEQPEQDTGPTTDPPLYTSFSLLIPALSPHGLTSAFPPVKWA